MRISDWSSDVCSSDLKAARMEQNRDSTDRFLPRFDAAGLVTAIVVDADTRALLMVAHMNAEAIERTRATGQAHFWSRSRRALWRKGETSGNGLNVAEMRVDRSEEHTSELQSLMRISYAVFCLKKKKQKIKEAYSIQCKLT